MLQVSFPKLKAESGAMLHLDVLRICASFAIVCYHWRDELTSSVFRQDMIMKATGGLSLPVDLFFIISGFVMFKIYAKRLSTRVQIGEFLQRRIARLYPLHVATFLFYLLLGIAAGILHLTLGHPENHQWQGILPTLLLIHSFPFCQHLSFNGPSWSISAEMLCYLTFPFVLWLTRQSRFFPFAISSLALGLLVSGTHSWSWTEWTYNFGCIRAVCPFVFGVALGANPTLLDTIPRPRLLLSLSGGGGRCMLHTRCRSWLECVLYILHRAIRMCC